MRKITQGKELSQIKLNLLKVMLMNIFVRENFKISFILIPILIGLCSSSAHGECSVQERIDLGKTGYGKGEIAQLCKSENPPSKTSPSSKISKETPNGNNNRSSKRKSPSKRYDISESELNGFLCQMLKAKDPEEGLKQFPSFGGEQKWVIPPTNKSALGESIVWRLKVGHSRWSVFYKYLVLKKYDIKVGNEIKISFAPEFGLVFRSEEEAAKWLSSLYGNVIRDNESNTIIAGNYVRRDDNWNFKVQVDMGSHEILVSWRREKYKDSSKFCR